MSYGIECDAGYYGSTLGNPTSSCTGACTCAPGFYCPSGHTHVAPLYCVSCPPGRTCAGGSSLPDFVPAGSYSYANSSAVSPCTTAVGRYCPSGSQNPSPGSLCDTGYRCPGGASDKIACTTCATGTYCPAGSTVADCVTVPEGRYAYQGNIYNCISDTNGGVYCPAGSGGSSANTYSSYVGPTVACPAGWCA